MCFFNSALGRYYSLHTALVFVLLALLAGWWQHQDADLALSALYYDAQTQSFPYFKQPLIYIFGKYLIWFIPWGGAVLWGLKAMPQPTPLMRALYWRVSLFFFSAPWLVWALKQFTAMPRPMYLERFGGELLVPQHFWATGFANGGGALPSAHATCGFILVAFYYIGWIKQNPTMRWGGLIAAVVAGLFFGYLRILQGYHSLSQVLWASAVIWLYASLWFLPLLTRAGLLSPTCAGTPDRNR